MQYPAPAVAMDAKKGLELGNSIPFQAVAVRVEGFPERGVVELVQKFALLFRQRGGRLQQFQLVLQSFLARRAVHLFQVFDFIFQLDRVVRAEMGEEIGDGSADKRGGDILQRVRDGGAELSLAEV